MAGTIEMQEAPVATLVVNESGETMPLDAVEYSAVRRVLEALGREAGACSLNQDVSLTTGQAAQIMGVSPRTVARLIDSGNLPGTRRGTGHRSVMLSDLLAFEERSRRSLPQSMERLRGAMDEMGMYDFDASSYLRQFG